jgi:hypothetical protein
MLSTYIIKAVLSIAQCQTDRPFHTAVVRSAAGPYGVRLTYTIQFWPKWIYRLCWR